MEGSNTIVRSTSTPDELNENENFNEQSDEVEICGGDKETDLGSVSKKRKRMVSSVWGYYEMLPFTEDGKQRCKCKKCGSVYQCDSKNGTGNLRRHLQNCKRRDSRDIGQLILQTASSSTVSMSDNKFDQQKFRDLLTACIIMHDLPFQCVEWTGLRALLLYIRRDLQLVSRNTTRSDCKKLFLREKSQIQSLLARTTSRVCLTSDLWTSINTDGFICLTAHFIDNNWRLQKKIINFGFMPPPHDGLALFEKLQSFIVEWKVDKKLFSITLDNASANTVSVDYLRSHLTLQGGLLCEGYFFHLRCCAHIINLIVHDGLKDMDISITKVRESIKYIKGSQVRKQKFLDCVKHSCLDSKRGLRQDVPTRWNSTYLMLDSAIYYKRAFLHLALVDSNFKTSPTTNEWEKIEKISSFLKLFYQITCVFSSTKKPTANLYFPCISTAYATLKYEGSNGSEYIQRMANSMLIKFEKYWSDFSTILAIAVILDPRYKFNFIEWCYRRVYGDDYMIEIRKVRDILFSLFSNYTKTSNQCSVGQSSQVVQTSQNITSTSSVSTVMTSEFLQDFDSFEEEMTMPKKSELELYLEEPRIERKVELDILHYWKGNQYRFPEVSAMARDVLCIPISTVASESAFSNSGRILDKYRSALKHDIVEALVCTRDWLYGDLVTTDAELDVVTEDVLNLNESAMHEEGESSRNRTL